LDRINRAATNELLNVANNPVCAGAFAAIQQFSDRALTKLKEIFP